MQAAVSALLQAVWTFAISLLVGRLALAVVAGLLSGRPGAGRRSRLVWSDVSRSVGARVFLALGTLIGLAVLVHLTPDRTLPRSQPFEADWRGALLLLLAGLVSAFLVALIEAARREALGRVRPARRLAWTAGVGMAGCCALLAVAAWVLGGAWTPLGPIWFAPALSLAAGFQALLGGLSRKPRPACWAAGLAWTAALLGFSGTAISPPPAPAPRPTGLEVRQNAPVEPDSEADRAPLRVADRPERCQLKRTRSTLDCARKGLGPII